MHARRPRPRSRPITDPLERRLLLAATVRTVSLLDQLGYGTTPATDVAADEYGDVYATRVGGDGTNDTQLLVIPAHSSTPQVLASFGPLTEYADTVEQPYGQLVVDAAGDVFGVTQFVSTSGDLPFGQDYTQGTLWELPAGFNVVDVLARFYKPQTAPRSLTIDADGNLYGVVDSLIGAGSSIFEYPADETGTVTTSLGAGESCAAAVVDSAGNVFGTLAASDDPTGPFSLFELKHGASAPTVLATVPATLGYDVQGLTIDAAGDLFVTTAQGPSGGTLLELRAGATAAELLPGTAGQAFNANPYVDGSGDVFATAGDATAGTSVVLELPAGGTALQTEATFTTGDATGVTMDALGNLYGTYADTVSGQATVFEVSGRSGTPTPTPTGTTTPSSTVTGLAAMVSRSNIPAELVGGTERAGTLTLSLTDTSAAAESGVATATVYATPAGSPAAAGTRLAAVSRRVQLPAGGGTSWVVRVPPTSMASGTYALLAVATDPSGIVIASDVGPTVTVAAPVVSLVASVSATPTTVIAGRWLTLTLVLTNGGNANASGVVNAAFGLLLNGNAVPLGTVRRNVTVKPGGKPVALRLRVRLPANTPAGSYLPTASVTQGAATASATGAVAVIVTAD
jgi:hypothetical protein